MWKRFVNDYLNYSHKERLGILTLTGLIVVSAFMPFLYPYLIHQEQYRHEKFDSEIARLKARQPDSLQKRYPVKNDGEHYNDYTKAGSKKYYAKITGDVFYFDPNTASAAEWKRLGVRDKTVQTIQRYVTKGGHFSQPEDISKIWGLHPEDINRLLPYVRIKQKQVGFVNSNSEAPSYPKRIPYKKNLKLLDINTADTSAFISLPGIGSKLAQRIINFRSKLGGFYMIEQVRETFGLPDSTFQKIKNQLTITGAAVKKIDINTALLDDMKSHPYIQYNVANAIIQYRSQHGNFLSVSELKRIMMVTDEIYKKIEPYITTDK